MHHTFIVQVPAFSHNQASKICRHTYGPGIPYQRIKDLGHSNLLGMHYVPGAHNTHHMYRFRLLGKGTKV
jgi:hypothetical protein